MQMCGWLPPLSFEVEVQRKGKVEEFGKRALVNICLGLCAHRPWRVNEPDSSRANVINDYICVINGIPTHAIFVFLYHRI